ncbi:MAG: D-aminoacylase [Beijerinckiaceae bacterium]|nr:D-aminoacylase [Beijerinckiaceae bacterium]
MTSTTQSRAPDQATLVIKGGLLIDGTGAPGRIADVAVAQGRVIAVGGRAREAAGARIIDAAGLVVAPGFIDTHTHDDRLVLDDPAMECKVTQGVTSVVVGLCGVSLAPRPPGALAPLPDPLGLLAPYAEHDPVDLADYASALRAQPPSVNVGALVGHSSLRAQVMDRFDRAATDAEIDAMAAMLDAAMTAGALGLSSGLAYEAGLHAPKREMSALAAVAGRHGGLYVSHIRDEGDRVVEAVEEAIAIGRAGRCPVVISHHKCLYRANWGKSVATLAAIDAACSEGMAVALDVYPYTASSTVLTLDRVRQAERVLVAWSAPHPDLGGRDLDEIAARWTCDRLEAAARLQPGGAIYFNMDEGDLTRIVQHPCCMIGSDGIPSHRHPHPRLWGSFPRVLGRQVREQGALTLENAVHKMTGLPARIFGFADRGVIAPGMAADIVLFDPAKVIDRATFAEPTLRAAGIAEVFVSGTSVMRAGIATHRPVGCVLSGRRHAAQGASHAA